MPFNFESEPDKPPKNKGFDPFSKEPAEPEQEKPKHYEDVLAVLQEAGVEDPEGLTDKVLAAMQKTEDKEAKPTSPKAKPAEKEPDPMDMGEPAEGESEAPPPKEKKAKPPAFDKKKSPF
jgi:hypothetical protein